MRRSSIRWRGRPSAILALTGLLVLASGCVTKTRYDRAMADNRQLSQHVERLEASTRSLAGERTKLIDELEDQRIVEEKLDKDLLRLKRSKADLSERLSRSEAALASSRVEVGELRGTYKGLLSDLEAEVAAGQIEIEQLRGGLRLNMTQDVLFASGSSEVNASGRAVLAKVAERLRGVPNSIVVEGHTDDIPIQSSRFPTNWELAGGRAAGVVRILASEGVGPERLSAVSRGETQPRDSNATPEGRARNRRIEITLEPARDAGAAVSAEPATGEEAPPGS